MANEIRVNTSVQIVNDNSVANEGTADGDYTNLNLDVHAASRTWGGKYTMNAVYTDADVAYWGNVVVAKDDASGADGIDNSDWTEASGTTSGTLPDDRFPATLPAISGANLTGISSGGIVASSYSSAGYARFSDGLIIQWGSGNSNAGIGFPITFPNACRQVTAVVEGTGFWDSENLQVGSFNTSNFTTKMQSKNRNTSWIAVGH